MNSSGPKISVFDLLVRTMAFGYQSTKNIYKFSYQGWNGDRTILTDACQQAPALTQSSDLDCTFTFSRLEFEEQKGMAVYTKSRTMSDPPKETVTVLISIEQGEIELFMLEHEVFDPEILFALDRILTTKYGLVNYSPMVTTML